MYIAPRDEVLFGDVFEAPYLFDVHLQDDAARLTTSEFPPKAPVSGAFYAEPQDKLPLAGDVVLAHGRSGREKEGREHRESYGLPGRAILLSDDCHIPTALGDRPDRTSARGRLLFAPIVPHDEAAVKEVAQGSNFSRFAMPGQDPIEPAIADLKRTFLVDARAIDPGHRIASLDDDNRLELEKRWNAFSCRRGPLASRENANKLGALIARSGGESSDLGEAVTTVWQVLDLAWDLEGTGLRSASDALEQDDPPLPVVERIIGDLRGLSALAAEAADKLESVKP